MKRKKLSTVLPRLLRQAIRSQGTTLSDYRTTGNQPGRFREKLRVYGRESESCQNCGRAIRRIRIAGRSSFYCPNCQR